MISVPGLLNTGGDSPENGDYFDKTIELFNLESYTSCRVNATLDRTRSGHSGHGDLVCGGNEGTDVISTCYNIITAETINLNEPRSDHTSWSTDSGVYLVGGQGYPLGTSGIHQYQCFLCILKSFWISIEKIHVEEPQ